MEGRPSERHWYFWATFFAGLGGTFLLIGTSRPSPRQLLWTTSYAGAAYASFFAMIICAVAAARDCHTLPGCMWLIVFGVV